MIGPDMWNMIERLPHIGVAEITMDGTIQRANAEFARICGEDVAHLIGRNVVHFTASEGRERCRKNLALLESSAEPLCIRHDKLFQTAAGKVSRCQSVWLSVRSGSGVPDRAINWVYELGEPGTDRVERLEQLLAEVLNLVTRSPQWNVNMIGTDNSQQHTASGDANQIVGAGNFLTGDSRQTVDLQTMPPGSRWTVLAVLAAIATAVWTLATHPTVRRIWERINADR